MKIFNSKAFRRSRTAYIGQCSFEYFASLLATDAFLATLLVSMGISDSTIGIISSISSFAFLFQIFSILIAKRIKTIKPIAIICNTASELFFMALYLLPFLNVSVEFKTVLVFVCILCAYFCNYLTSGFIFKWGNSFVAPTNRATFSATKEMVSLISGMIFSLVLGYVISYYQESDNLMGGFLFTSIALLVNNLCNFICLCLIKKDIPQENLTPSIPIRRVLKDLIKNKNFICVVIMLSLWTVAKSFTTGFLGTFKTKDLLISVGTVQIVNIFGNAGRFFFSKPFGKYSDKFSFAKGFKLAIYIEIIAYISLLFITGPERWWLIVIYTVLFNISTAGTNANSMNIIYSYVDKDYFVQATAIKNIVCGILSFVTAIIAGQILEFVQENGNAIFGIHMYGQQFLACISIILMVITILFITNIVEKQKVKIQ